MADSQRQQKALRASSSSKERMVCGEKRSRTTRATDSERTAAAQGSAKKIKIGQNEQGLAQDQARDRAPASAQRHSGGNASKAKAKAKANDIAGERTADADGGEGSGTGADVAVHEQQGSEQRKTRKKKMKQEDGESQAQGPSRHVMREEQSDAAAGGDGLLLGEPACVPQGSEEALALEEQTHGTVGGASRAQPSALDQTPRRACMNVLLYGSPSEMHVSGDLAFASPNTKAAMSAEFDELLWTGGKSSFPFLQGSPIDMRAYTDPNMNLALRSPWAAGQIWEARVASAQKKRATVPSASRPLPSPRVLNETRFAADPRRTALGQYLEDNEPPYIEGLDRLEEDELANIVLEAEYAYSYLQTAELNELDRSRKLGLLPPNSRLDHVHK